MSMFKHYKFHCPKCSEYFEKGMWTKSSGEQEPIECPSCKEKMTHTDETRDMREVPKHGSESAALNLREKWKNKIPGEYKEWMEGPFSKRHGTEQTINMRD